MNDYRKDALCETPSLNASVAKILLAQSPLHAWLAHPRLNPNYTEDHDRAYDLGNAAHACLLGGADKLCVIDADDYRTKAAKEARDAAINADKLPVLGKQADKIHAMVDEARKAWANNADLDGYTLDAGEAEKTLIWNANLAPIHGHDLTADNPMRGKLDWLSNDKRLTVDYKTTEGSAHPTRWARTGLDQGADVQAAFYLWAVASLFSQADARFVFMVQEAYAPYCCSFVGVSPMMATLGSWKVHKAVGIWIDCLTRNEWPGYPTRICYPDPPAWAFNEMEAE